MTGYRLKFLDGTPVPEDYAAAVARMVSHTAADDPGEGNDPTRTDAQRSQDDLITGRLQWLENEIAKGKP